MLPLQKEYPRVEDEPDGVTEQSHCWRRGRHQQPEDCAQAAFDYQANTHQSPIEVPRPGEFLRMRRQKLGPNFSDVILRFGPRSAGKRPSI